MRKVKFKDEENYCKDDTNSFNKFLKTKKTKRKRVVDTSKLLKMLEEMEEQDQFRHIMDSDYIQIDIN